MPRPSISSIDDYRHGTEIHDVLYRKGMEDRQSNKIINNLNSWAQKYPGWQRTAYQKIFASAEPSRNLPGLHGGAHWFYAGIGYDWQLRRRLTHQRGKTGIEEFSNIDALPEQEVERWSGHASVGDSTHYESRIRATANGDIDSITSWQRKDSLKKPSKRRLTAHQEGAGAISLNYQLPQANIRDP